MSGEQRGRNQLMQTITNEVELEKARLASLPSVPPPTVQAQSTVREALPSLPEAEPGANEAEIVDLGSNTAIATLRARLSPLSRVPVLTKKISELGPLMQDPKAAYVLGFIDGLFPLETIVDVTGLPEIDTLTILDRLVSQGVVDFSPRR